MKYIIWTLLVAFNYSDCRSQDLTPFPTGNLWGYKDKKGVVVIEPQFQYAAKFKDNIAIVAKNGKVGAIDSNQNIIIPFQYEFLQPLDTSEFLFGYRAKYFGEHIMGVMTRHERVKIPAEYNSILKERNYYTIIKTKDSVIGTSSIGDLRSRRSYYGLIDNNGKLIIPCMYDYINWINDSLIDVTRGGLGTSHALFNKNGEQLTGFEYMVFGNFIEGIAKARIENKFGFIYPNGKIAIPIMFDYCEEFINGYSIIKQVEKWGAIDKNGKIIIEPKFEYQEVKNILKEKYGR